MSGRYHWYCTVGNIYTETIVSYTDLIILIVAPAPPTPTGVASTLSGSTIAVTWDVPTLSEAKGFVSYTVTFEPSNEARRKRETSGQCSSSPCNPVPVEEGGVVIAGVDPGTTYSFNVAPTNEENVVGVAASRIELGELIQNVDHMIYSSFTVTLFCSC